jgi:hypothetical protein
VPHDFCVLRIMQGYAPRLKCDFPDVIAEKAEMMEYARE